MQPINRALRIISIQHELAMNIGLDLQLEAMLNTFMQRAQLRLSLSSVMICVMNDNQNDYLSSETVFPSYCYPPKLEKNQYSWLVEHVKAAFKLQRPTHMHIEHQSQHFYLFYVPEFGVLILERKHKPIDEMILAALLPLLIKLAASCQACQEHQTLLEEIDARKKAEELLIRQSMLDPLTGLANRTMFNLNLARVLSNSKRNGKHGAIFIVDLDRFKIINDSLGHSVGDEVLKIISQRLSKCIDRGDTLARVGSDEFVLLIVELSAEHSSALNQAEEIAGKISALTAEPIHVGENILSVSNSTGISLFPTDENSKLTIEQQCGVLVKNADLAMYQVKQGNRNGFSFFNQELQSYFERKTKIETSLRTAIQQHEFSVLYQPLVSASGNILGAEALLRWSNTELGHISPADFIPVAEDSGLILDIGTWVIEQVCKLVKSMQDNALENLPKYISVNVSPRQFVHQNFAESLLSILNKYGVDSSRIRVEITEGVAIGNIELTIQKMLKLKKHGVVCMLDDFGCGYSSLSYLHQLPLQTIKIDKSFISDIDTSNNHRVIVNSIIDICEHFSLECIVEGVETSGEFDYLSTKKITAYQGYYFHKPMSEDKFVTLLSE